jgi:hypothetical protein
MRSGPRLVPEEWIRWCVNGSRALGTMLEMSQTVDPNRQRRSRHHERWCNYITEYTGPSSCCKDGALRFSDTITVLMLQSACRSLCCARHRSRRRHNLRRRSCRKFLGCRRKNAAKGSTSYNHRRVVSQSLCQVSGILDRNVNACGSS